MQILAGFPQHVFYEALGAGLYSALRLTQNWSWRLAAGLLAIYLGGAAISAVQLLPTGQTMRETIRGLPLPRSEEHTSELQSRFDLVCRLLLEKKKERR